MLCCITKVSGNMIHGKMKGCYSKEKVKRSKADQNQYTITQHFIQIQCFFKSKNVHGQLKPWVMSFALLPFFLHSLSSLFSPWFGLKAGCTLTKQSWEETLLVFFSFFLSFFFFYGDKIELWLEPWITSLTPLPLDSQGLVTSDIRPDIRSKQEHYPSISYFPTGGQL